MPYLACVFTFHSLSISWIQIEFNFCLTYSFSIHFLFREKTSNLLSPLRINFEFTLFIRNSLGIPIFFAIEFTFYSLFFRSCTFNSLSASRIHMEFPTFFANLLSIQYLFCKLTTNSLLFLRIHVQFTIFIANSLGISYLFGNSPWIYNLIRESTLNSLSFSQIHFAFTINLASSLSIYFLYREFTCNSLFDFCELTFN